MQVRFGFFVHGEVIERMHLQFMKKLLGVKRTTQNDFIYGELIYKRIDITVLLSIGQNYCIVYIILYYWY